MPARLIAIAAGIFVCIAAYAFSRIMADRARRHDAGEHVMLCDRSPRTRTISAVLICLTIAVVLDLVCVLLAQEIAADDTPVRTIGGHVLLWMYAAISFLGVALAAHFVAVRMARPVIALVWLGSAAHAGLVSAIVWKQVLSSVSWFPGSAG